MRRTALLQAVLLRTALLVALWWMLTGGSPEAWTAGVPVIALALLAWMRVQGGGAIRLSPAGIPGFLLFFLSHSVKGGVQVAWMAAKPRTGLQPGLVDIALRLPGEPERLFLVGILNLLPGTLSVGLEDGRLQLHVLDRQRPAEREVRLAEARVARLFGVELR